MNTSYLFQNKLLLVVDNINSVDLNTYVFRSRGSEEDYQRMRSTICNGVSSKIPIIMYAQKEYIFWSPWEKSAYSSREEQAFEIFLQYILTPDQLQTREIMRTMEAAIKIVVDEIIDTEENQISD
jgi:hypothetical protein